MGQNLFNEPVAADTPTLREFDTAAIAGIVLKEHPLKTDFETVGNDAANGVKDGDPIVLTTPTGAQHRAFWNDGEGGTGRISVVDRFTAAQVLTALPNPALWPAVDDYGRPVVIRVPTGIEKGIYQHNGVSWEPTELENSYTVGSVGGGGGDVTIAQLNAVVSTQDARDDAQDLLIATNIADITALKTFDSALNDESTKQFILARSAPTDGDIPAEVDALTGVDAEPFDKALVRFVDFLVFYEVDAADVWTQGPRVEIGAKEADTGTLAGLSAKTKTGVYWVANETPVELNGLYFHSPSTGAQKVTGTTVINNTPSSTTTFDAAGTF